MKLFNKITKEVYHFDADQIQHDLCQQKITDANYIEINETFNTELDTYDELTKKSTTNKTLQLTTEIDKKIILAHNQYTSDKYLPITYNKKVYQTNELSVNALASKISAIQAGWVVSATFKWKALDNTLVPFTARDIKSLYLEIELRNQTKWSKYQTLKTKIKAAKTLTALNKIKV